MNWIRWTLIAQLVFFLGWAGLEEWKRVGAPEVLLETVPVDPRDLLSGKYMDLRYAINNTANLPGFPMVEPRLQSKVGVKLLPQGETRVGNEVFRVWKPVECQVPPPMDAGNRITGYWVTGTYVGGGRVIYGIERYYFSEKRQQEMDGLGSGHVFVEATVSSQGGLSFKRLVY